jgi:hypothetical protein
MEEQSDKSIFAQVMDADGLQKILLILLFLIYFGVLTWLFASGFFGWNIFPLILGFIMIFLMFIALPSRSMRRCIYLLFIPLVIFLGLFGILQTFMEAMKGSSLFLAALLSLIIGASLNYLIRKNSPDGYNFVSAGINYSYVLAVFNAVYVGVYYAVKTLQEAFSQLADSSAGAGLVSMFNFDIPNPYILFATIFICFNISFVWSHLKEGKGLNGLYYYFLPIFVFIIVSILIKMFTMVVLSGVMTTGY